MSHAHTQIGWDPPLVDDLQRLLKIALQEDLNGNQDLTTQALVPADARGTARVVARVPGVVAGIQVGEELTALMETATRWEAHVADGTEVRGGDCLATWRGSAQEMLTGERTLLNVLCHLSGIATLTHQFTQAVAGTGAKICDTRKTLPGWRRLQKYAVRCGGGCNHRMGLFDAVLIKDNHLSWGAQAAADQAYDLVTAVQQARARAPETNRPIIEIEVDTLAQLKAVLPALPDIVLLDNMDLESLRAAVALRDEGAPQVLLEASGGVNLESVAAIATTGVERISVGALTHSVTALDLGLDWDDPAG